MQNIDDQLREYSPSPEGIALLQDTEIVLLVGITGAGKNTVLDEMLKTGEFYDLVTTIARPPRKNNGVLEREGIDYHFVTDEQAQKLLDDGAYVEASPVHGRVYGVTVDEIRRAHDNHKMAIADIDVQGVAKYKKISDRIIAIFVVPPSFEEWQRRVRQRYPSEGAFLEDWPNRRKSTIMELERALAAPYYHFVINDDLAEAVDACIKIAHRRDEFVRKDDEVRLLTRDLLDTLLHEI